MKKIVLITGVGRRQGLGYETARQLGEKGYKVIITARRQSQLDPLVEELKAGGADVESVVMDIADENSVAKAAEWVCENIGRVDVIINNAALMMAESGDIETEPIDVFKQQLITNVAGPFTVVQKFLPLLRKSEHPRIVNVSSGAGSFCDKDYGLQYGQYGASCYGITKLALNGVTVKMARELKDEHILVNSVCPDVSNTYGSMGRPVSESAKSPIWAAELPDDGPTGGFFRDGKPLPW